MARIRIASTSGASENTIVFSPAGGHSHNGRNSSLIDSTAYSIYDFSPTFVGTEVNPDRAVRQENNRIAFEDLIKRVVNNSVLAPAGIRLEPGSLNGSLIIANTITANQLAANTITASQISAGTITANELSSNIVLINNRIVSQNWNGTIQANGTIFSNGIGSAGWAITNTHAVFDSTLIRGSIAANSLLTPNLTISNTGAITSTSFNVTAGGNVTATNANITGSITSGSGTIGGWTIDTARIYGGSTYLYSNGSMAIGATTLASNGRITNGNFTLSAAGELIATNANIAGSITATTLTATTSGRIGPFDLTATSLKSTSYNAQNYMEILNYGDIGIYSAPLSGSHSGMSYNTQLVGEYIVVGRTDLGTDRYVTMGSPQGQAGNVGFEIIENGSSRFSVYQNGNVSLYGTLNGYSFTSGRHNGGNQMVHTDIYGYLQVGYINSGDAPYNENNASSPDRVWGSNGGGDSYLRTYQTSSLSVGYAGSAGSYTGSTLSTGHVTSTVVNGTNSNFRAARPYVNGENLIAFFDTSVASAAAGGIKWGTSATDLIVWDVASDIRLKNNVRDFDDALDLFRQVRPVKFNWKSNDAESHGFIAQELMEVYPFAVLEPNTDSEYYGLSTLKMVPLMAAAMKGMISKIDELEARIQTLEGV
jgi:hypothetical protein